MTDTRPDPDELLHRVQRQEARLKRGRLKIFFGAAPGVGKTYAMLQAARDKAREGIDVVVGFVQPQARQETQALVLGLDVLPRREVEYRGNRYLEFNLEAALARRPQLLIVDELAHTNLPISGQFVHNKRWQDVEDLLTAGIDVYTTLNVQHIESLNDVVAQITGVTVRETVPDSVFDAAEDVELVDLPPDDLLDRLREGKVYVAVQAALATDHFFRKGNLIALRELALRRTADRVNAQMEDYRQENTITGTWPTGERLLVCVGASPSSAHLIRCAARIAQRLKAPWIAVHLETAADAHLSPENRGRLIRHLNLAEQLGAETAVLNTAAPVEEVLRYARLRNVNRMIVGKPRQPRWRELLGGSFVYELTRRCGEIDIYVTSGDTTPAPAPQPPLPDWRGHRRDYLFATGLVALCTAVAWVLWKYVVPLNLIMIYLLGIVMVAVRGGRGPAALMAVLSVALFDYCFVPPYGTFGVSDVQYLFTFGAMLITGLTIGTLTASVKFQAESAWQREHRTAALYSLSRELAAIRTISDVAQTAQREIGEALAAEVAVLLPGADTRLGLATAHEAHSPLDEHELGVAEWVLDHGERAGLGTETLAGAAALYLPLPGPLGCIGVLRVCPHQPERGLLPDQIGLLETLTQVTALAIQRIQLAQVAEQARLETEGERLRNSLLSAVSHDLRTPLSAIMGASSALLAMDLSLEPNARRELAESIFDESGRLDRQVANLLEMTRLENGTLQPHAEWQPLEEVVGVALNRLEHTLRQHVIRTSFPASLPLVSIDALLIQEVLINLLENAAKYSPAGTTIDISARDESQAVCLEIADQGIGLAPGEERLVFDMFYRSRNASHRSGVGLGLTICKGIVELHHGSIEAANRPEGGLSVRLRLPVTVRPPGITIEAKA